MAALGTRNRLASPGHALSQSRSDSRSHRLDPTFRTLGEVVECVLADRSHFTGLVAGDCTHETEHAHCSSDEQDRHSQKRTPKETWRPTAPEGHEETAEADGDEQQPQPGSQWTSDPQDLSYFPVLGVDLLFFVHF